MYQLMNSVHRDSEYIEDETASIANQSNIVPNFSDAPVPQIPRPPSSSAYFAKRHEVSRDYRGDHALNREIKAPVNRPNPKHGFLPPTRALDQPLVATRRRVPTPTNAFQIDIESVRVVHFT